jgi:hypothetical protein
MPVNNCVRKDDKIYCINTDTKKIEVYTIEYIGVEDCPEDVLRSLLHKLIDSVYMGEE